MKCLACGRQLRNRYSQEAGYGPVCYRKLFGSNVHNNGGEVSPSVDVMSNYEVPGQMALDDYLQENIGNSI